MTSRLLVVVGGGEHARVVIEAAQAAGWEPIGYTDPDAATTSAMPIPHLGGDDELLRRHAELTRDARPALVLGFGGRAEGRRRAVEAAGAAGVWATIVHPSAWVSPSAGLEPGAIVLAGAVVNAGAVVGAHAIVNSRAVVEHDVIVGAFTHLAPGATIGGGTRIGEDAFIGLGAAVRDHVAIGRGAVVGMGAVVTGDVAAGAVIVATSASERTSDRTGPIDDQAPRG